MPCAGVLALPPAGADADERPTAGEHVERGRGLGGDAGRPVGHRRAPACRAAARCRARPACRASPRARGSAPTRGRPAGSGSGGPSARSPRTRPRRPRARPRAARPPGPRPTGTGTPGARPPAPGSPPVSPAGGVVCLSTRSGASSGTRPGSGATSWTTSQPSAASSSAHGPHPLQLTGQHRCGHRPVAGGVAPPALGVGGREDDGDGRQPGAPRGGQPGRPPVRRRGRGCRRRVVRPRPSRAATMVSSSANASVEASRSCGPLPTTPRSASEETISSRR